MRKIRLDFNKYADAPLLVLAQGIDAALTGSTFFPVVDPSLTDFKAAITAYSNALSAAQNRGKDEVAAKNVCRKALIDTLVLLANDITKTAAGNLQALISSGFPLTKEYEPALPMGTAVIVSIQPGLNAGQLDILLKKLSGARTYVYQYTQDPPDANAVWTDHNSSRIKETISGLEPGKRYWVRIVAYGSNQQMTVCQPVLSKIVQ